MNTLQLKPDVKATKTMYAQGNDALRQGDYGLAITMYAKVLIQQYKLPRYLSANLSIARKKYRMSRQSVEKIDVAVCGWDLAHNAAGRVFTLATLYEAFANVKIIGSLFPCHGRDIWGPIRDTSITKHTITIDDESKFVVQALKIVSEHPCDVVHLSKPRIPNIFFGIMYKLLWDSKVLIDIDDEELAFVGAKSPLNIDSYINQIGKLPELKNLIGKEWTRLAVGLVQNFDGLTVANHALQQRYGGQIVRHARNEMEYHTLSQQRRINRARFGISQDAKVVMFLGTPRRYKGLVETAEAIASFKRRDIVFVIIGDFLDDSLKDQLQSIAGVNYTFIANQPIDVVAAMTAIGDACVLFQNPQSTAACYQTPAKLSDALACRLPVLVSETAALVDAILEGALLPVTQETLLRQLTKVLDNEDTVQNIQQVGLKYFQRELSFAANVPRLQRAVKRSENRHLDKDLHAFLPYINAELLATLQCFTKKNVSINNKLSKNVETISDQKIAIAVYIDYPELWPEISQRLQALCRDFDLFVTTTPDHAEAVTSNVWSVFPDAHIEIQDNYGMDIASFLRLVPTLIEGNYLAVCKLHTKKGMKGQGDLWRNLTLDALIGDNASFDQISDAFVSAPSLQMAGTAELYMSAQNLMLDNFNVVRDLFQKLEARPLPNVDWGFFSGAMFWARPALLEKLARKILANIDQFETNYKKDGQFAHAIERIFGLLPGLCHGKIGLFHLSRSCQSTHFLQIASALSIPNQTWMSALFQQYTHLDTDLALLGKSGLFDDVYYRKQCPHLLNADIDPARHYLLIGRSQGKTPNPDFDPIFYTKLYGNQLKGNEDSFVHYLREGAKAGLLLRSTKEQEEQEIPSFRYRALNTVLIDWKTLARQRRDPDRISIIIPVYKNPDLTRNCIESIYQNTSTDSFELIIVDNGSEALLRNLLNQYSEQYANLRIVTNPENFNFALGCNVGFAASNGEKVVFLNSDTTVTDNWLGPLTEPLNRSEISTVQPRLLFPEGSIQCMGVVFSEKSSVGYPIYADMQPDESWVGRSRFFQAVTGACMAIRAEDYAMAEGFDPIYINGQEDIDLCLRLNLRNNQQSWYTGDSTVYHLENHSPDRNRYIMRNRAIFVKRWARKIRADDQEHYLEDGFVVQIYKPDTEGWSQSSTFSTWRPILMRITKIEQQQNKNTSSRNLAAFPEEMNANEEARKLNFLKTSKLFDSINYLEKNQTVVADYVDPTWHHLHYGVSQEPDLSYIFEPISQYVSWGEVNQLSANRIQALEFGLAQRGMTQVLKTDNESFEIEESFVLDVVEADVVSFDIFDTLLVRNCVEPMDIFRLIELQLSSDRIYFGSFTKERIKAERQARKKSAFDEVTLNEIYHEWKSIAGVSDELVDTIMRIEIDTELENIRPRELGICLLNHAKNAKKIINLISDFYMTGEVVECMLEQCNVTGYDKLIVSCDYRATKHTGSLYRKYTTQYDKNIRFLHVGDNRHSDGTMAVKYGLKPFILSKRSERPEVVKAITKLWGDNAEQKMSGGFSKSAAIGITSSLIDSFANEPQHKRTGYDETPYMLGFSVLGPMFAGMAAFVAKIAKQRKYDKLFFASRDGYYIMAAYDCFAKQNSDLPASKYFFSSRKLANASVLEHPNDILKVADIDFAPCRLGDLLSSRFNLRHEDLADIPLNILQCFGFSSIYDSIHQGVHQVDLHNIVKLLVPKIVQRNKTARENYIGYLSQIGMDQGNVAIVDIGYSGTIQLATSRILERPIGAVYFITWKRAQQIDQAGLQYDSFLGKQVDTNHLFNKYVQLFELMFSATHPSVIGLYKASPNQYLPIYSKQILPQRTLSVLSELHRGAIDYVTEFANSSLGKIDVFEEMAPSDFTIPIFNFFENPSPAAANLFNNIIFEDDFGGSEQSLISNMWCQSTKEDRAMKDSIWKEGAKSLVSGKRPMTLFTPSVSHAKKFVHRGRPYAQVDIFNEYGLLPGYGDIVPKQTFDSKTNDRSYKFLLLVWVRQTDYDNLDSFIRTLAAQNYDQWRLLIVLETPSPEIENLITAWRIRIPGRAIELTVEENISASILNASICIEWIVYASVKVRLEKQFLAELLLEALHSQCDIIYSDHQENSDNCGEGKLVFKPSWSPELLKGQNYIGSVYALSRSCALLSPALLEVKAPSLAHLLALSELSLTVVRIPRILWSLTEDKPGNLSIANQDLKAVSESFRKEGIDCNVKEVTINQEITCYRPFFPDDGPSVAIIIPTKNALKVLSTCISSLDKTTYKNFKVYIIDNDSDDPETISYLQKTKHTVLRVSSPRRGFNYSYINNVAAKAVSEDYLLFLNNDTEVITPEWLSQMMGWGRISGVGSVGARLLFQNGKVQHAGLVNGLLQGVLPAPAFKLIDREDPGYLGYAKITRNYAAMTAACMLTPRKLFLELGAFNESDFGVAYNDCDYGFRLVLAGYRNVYCAEAELYHYEGFTRGIGIGNDNPAEEAECVKAYGKWADPFYNPNLELDRTDFTIATRTPAYRNIPRIRGLFVTHNLNYEGAPLILCEIVIGIARSHNMEVLLVSPKDGPLRARYEKEGVKIKILKNLPIFSTSEDQYHTAISYISQLIVELEVDVVFANTVLTWWAIDAARNVGIPNVWCIHESETPFSHFDEHGSFLKSSAQHCLNYPYQVVFVSQATKKLFESLAYRGNFTVINNGFDSTRLNNQVKDVSRSAVRAKFEINEDEIAIITVGTVCDRKNQLELVEALKIMSEGDWGRIKVFIIGDRQSDYSQLLQEAIAELPEGLKERISLIPETNDIGQFYLAGDLFVLTSKLESFPVVIQEAMSFSLPIVVHPSFGIREQVVNEKSALFYSLGDHDELAKQIQRLIYSKELRRRLGRNARVSLDKMLTLEMMIDNHATIIKEAWISGCPRGLGNVVN